jgi:hypothetical protein
LEVKAKNGFLWFIEIPRADMLLLYNYLFAYANYAISKLLKLTMRRDMS